jgi:hypothetical protein
MEFRRTGDRVQASLACAGAALVSALLAGCPLEIEESLGRELNGGDAALDAVTTELPDAADAGEGDAPDDGKAGDVTPEGPTACITTTTNQTEAMDGGMGLECTANESDAGGVSSSHVGKLLRPVRAGEPYLFTYDRVLAVSVGQPVKVDVYGSNAPDTCTVEEKLFTMILDGTIDTWTQSYCFTPKKDYAYIVSNVSTQGNFYYNSVSFSGTLCVGCTM